MAEMCDTNATYETESFKCKALRKYAAYHGKELQNVTMDEVAQSPQGLQGWGEMEVIVRGINESMPPTPATSSTPTPNVAPGAAGSGDTGTGTAGTRGKRRGRGGGEESDVDKPRKKAKREVTGAQRLMPSRCCPTSLGAARLWRRLQPTLTNSRLSGSGPSLSLSSTTPCSRISRCSWAPVTMAPRT